MNRLLQQYLLHYTPFVAAGVASGVFWSAQIPDGTLWRSILMDTLYYVCWGTVALPLFRLAEKYPLRKEKIAQIIAIILAGNIIAPLLVAAMYATVTLAIRFIQSHADDVPVEAYQVVTAEFRLFFGGPFAYYGTFLIYYLVVAIAYARAYRLHLSNERLRNLTLQTQLAQAQLQTLKMQLHPHFFFNTLNSISSLLQFDPHAADKMLTRLGEFLRLTLDNATLDFVSLSQELSFLKAYLDIEQVRFEERLELFYDVDVSDHKVKVPNLILQPFIENSIRHAISKRIRPGWIRIAARQQNGRLHLRVADSGPEEGLESNPVATASGGIGVSNTRERLRQLYGDQFALDFTVVDGGLVVEIAFPIEAAR